MKTSAVFFSTLAIISLSACTFLGSTPADEKAAQIAQQVTENAELMMKVGSLMIVPNEEPIIATINESAKLIKEQAFYQGSQDGDKLIIFAKAQKAVIYSPARNIIVNSGPFTINDTPAVKDATATVAPVKK